MGDSSFEYAPGLKIRRKAWGGVGVGVIEGVRVGRGVRVYHTHGVLLGVSVMVGERVMVGLRVIVGVSVMVGEREAVDVWGGVPGVGVGVGGNGVAELTAAVSERRLGVEVEIGEVSGGVSVAGAIEGVATNGFDITGKAQALRANKIRPDASCHQQEKIHFAIAAIFLILAQLSLKRRIGRRLNGRPTIL